jgi:anti-sigma factor RsiW
MSDIEIHHLGAAYALDALDERERTAYEAHFGTCDICRTDVREYRATAAELASLTATQPPPDVKARVMSEIATTRQLSPLPPSVVRLADRRPNRVMTVGERSPPRRCSSSLARSCSAVTTILSATRWRR